MATLVYSVDHPELPPLAMPDRFRQEIAYFMAIPGEHGVPKVGPREYWIPLADARQCFDDGVIRIISPLDSENRTEIELSEEQEEWLQWMLLHKTQHVRIE